MYDMDVMYWLPGSDEVTDLHGQREVASVYIKDFTNPWDELKRNNPAASGRGIKNI